MKKWINRIKYWIYVRRFHIDGVRMETTKRGVDIIVEVNGKQHVIETLTDLDGNSCGVTDYGIAKIAERAR